MFAASFREPRSQPFVKMTPPMSQNNVVISVKGAAPSMLALVIRPYHSMNANVKGYEIYCAAIRLFPSVLLRMVSNCIRPCSTPRTRCDAGDHAGQQWPQLLRQIEPI